MKLLEQDRIEVLSVLTRPMFPDAVCLSFTDPREPAYGLWPQETAHVTNAIEKRRREYAAGRRAARNALKQLGEPFAAIGTATDRSPIWPEGIVGSIAHNGSTCIATLARSSEIRSLGVDIEDDTPLSTDLEPIICTKEERRWLEGFAPHHRRRYAKIIFSAKECVYKCQYPLTGEMLDFHAVTIHLGKGFGQFHAEFNVDAGMFHAGDLLVGNVVTGHDMIVTGMTLRT